MLKIYPVCLAMVKDVKTLADAIAAFDRDLARQLRRASVSVVLNVAEGSAVRDGRRRVRYGDALGSARETFAGLEVGVAAGYLPGLESAICRRFDRIIGTLVKLV
jgi:four helix bundle protein